MNGSVLLTFSATCGSWGEPIAAQLRVYKRPIVRKTDDSCADTDSDAVVSLLAERRGGRYHLWQSVLLSREELLRGQWVVFENLQRHCMRDVNGYRMKISIEDSCAEVDSSSFSSEAFLIAVLAPSANTVPLNVNETDVHSTYSQASKRSTTPVVLEEHCELRQFNVRIA